MKHRYALSLALMMSSATIANAETISTAEIISAAASASCIDYQLVGICFWLDCGGDGCDVKTTPKVGHHNPDLVVSAHNGAANNPWREANSITGKVSSSAIGAILNASGNIPAGANRASTGDDLETMKFKGSDAIGHPLASIPMGYRCPSQATPFKPYFISGTDAIAWRLGLPESVYPEALVPGRREIGNYPANTWGSVYPRSGFISQSSDAKAAAVIAQRVGDLVTRTGQPHVYQPLTGKPSYRGKIWPPGALRENTDKEGSWQMLTPEKSNTCSVFGENDTASLTGWDGGKQASTGSYAWTLWRPYECCKKTGDYFLFDINFKSYP